MSGGVWLWLLLLPLALLVAYLLHHGGKLRPVSSVLLWRSFEENALRGRRMRLPRLRASLLLALGILVALALAAADPRVGGAAREEAVAVIVDLSASMEAAAPGRDRRVDDARSVALDILARHRNAGSRLQLLAGEGLQVDQAGPGDAARLEEALAGSETGSGDLRLGELVAAASEIVRARGGGRVYVVSDFAGAQAPEELEGGDVGVIAVHVGAVEDNVAVTELLVDRSLIDGRREIAAMVHNAGATPVEVSIEATVDGSGVAGERVRLEAGSRQLRRFTIGPAVGELEVRVSPGGGLASDDRLGLQLRPAPVILPHDVRGLPPELVAALRVLDPTGSSVSTGVTPRPMPGERENPAGDTIVLLHDRLPESLPPRWIFVAGSTDDPGPAASWASLDPIGDGLELLAPYDPVFVRSSAVRPSAPDDLRPIATVGGEAVIGIVEGEDSLGIWWGVAPGRTDLDERGLLPLVLDGMARRLVGASGSSSSPESADLTPRPPVGSVSAADFLAASPGESLSLRPWLLSIAAMLLLIEAGRRSRKVRRETTRSRGSVAPPDEPARVGIAVASGGG